MRIYLVFKVLLLKIMFFLIKVSHLEQVINSFKYSTYTYTSIN